MTMKCVLNNLDGQVEGSNKDPEAQHEENNSVEDLQSAVVIEDNKEKSVL